MNLQLLHKVREESLERLEVTIGEGNLNGHYLNPQTHVDLQEEGQGKRRYLFGTLRGGVKAPLNRNTPSLTNN